MLLGVHLEEYLAPRFVHILCELFIQDSMQDEDVSKHVSRERARILAQLKGEDYAEYDYDSTDVYGMSNDNAVGAYSSGEPLPYIAPTMQTDDGFVGLDPPMG